MDRTLDFLAGQHDGLASVLGLDGSEVIEIPYNKYLEKMEQLELTDVAALGEAEANLTFAVSPSLRTGSLK